MNSPANNKTFLEHLEELRKLIFKILLTLIVLFPASFYFADDFVRFMVAHSCPPNFALSYFSPMEPLFVKIKISLLAAFILGLPYIAYVVWKFVVPALYPHEKRVVKRFAFSSWLLFIGGAAFCFFLIIPAMMRFSLSMGNDKLHPTIGLSNYIGLSGMLLLGFGIMFQIPIAIFFMAVSGMIDIATLKKLRGVVLVVIFALSALLTPPDVFSQLLMAAPTYLLFELSLLVSSIALRNRKTVETEETEFVSDLPASDYPEDDFFPTGTEAEPEDYTKYYRSPPKKRKIRYISRR